MNITILVAGHFASEANYITAVGTDDKRMRNLNNHRHLARPRRRAAEAIEALAHGQCEVE